MLRLFPALLCQNSYATLGVAGAVPKDTVFKISAILGVMAYLCVVFAPVAQAGVTGFNPAERKSVIYTTTFDDVSQSLSPRLDWRSPSTKIDFDVPDSAWVENIDLLISAYPEGKVNRTAPLLVQLNHAKPIRVVPGGDGFDAQITLDRSQIRARNNTIKFTYDLGSQGACAGPEVGAWHLDLENSQIIIKARTKARPMQIRDVRDWLTSPVTAPHSIAITAKGPDKDTFEALSAQAVSLNMPHLPKFKTSSQRADMQIIIGTREDIKGFLKDDYALQDAGPRLSVGESYPPQIVITGDTNDEVLDMVKAFATYEMPPARRRKASPGEFYFRTPFDMKRYKISGRKDLAQLGALSFDKGWGTHSQSVLFDVDNPATRQGKAVIKFTSAATLSPESSVTVSINGKTLGKSQLDARLKSVTFDIPRGLLQGLNNRLTIAPDLIPVTGETGCTLRGIVPGFTIGTGSYIDIKKDRQAMLNDLSRFTASGYPFASERGADTTIILPEYAGANRDSALRLLGQLARASGYGWSAANFTSDTSPVQAQRVLIVRPIDQTPDSLMNTAPRGLKNTLYGTSVPRESLVKTTARSTPVNLLSVREGTSRINGGVAALFANPSNQTVGIISAMKGQSFTRNIDTLVDSNHWNQLEGSVAKWNAETVIMAQTALPAEYYNIASLKAPVERIHRFSNGFKIHDFALPDLGFKRAWGGFNDGFNTLADRTHTLIWDRDFRPVAKPKRESEIMAPKIVAKTKPIPVAIPKPSVTKTAVPQAQHKPVSVSVSPKLKPQAVSTTPELPIYEPPSLRRTLTASEPKRHQSKTKTNGFLENDFLDKASRSVNTSFDRMARTTSKWASSAGDTLDAVIHSGSKKVQSLLAPKNFDFTNTNSSNSVQNTRMTFFAIIGFLLLMLMFFAAPKPR